MPGTETIEIGVDTGGTFTDVFARGVDGRLHLAKVPSSRRNPAAPIGAVLTEILPGWGLQAAAVRRFVHGTTVATNAVLERRGARLGLLTTEGFTDVIEIGRINRGLGQMYKMILEPATPVFLAPRERRQGVVEAIEVDGTVSTPLDRASLEAAVARLLAQGVDAIAVCFMFSFVNPAHEEIAAAYIRDTFPDIAVSVSSEVDPGFREYERTVVTAFDAYVKPALGRYLLETEDRLAAAGVPAPLQVMQSRGGVASAGSIRSRPIRLFLSGPAAGVVGAGAVGREAGFDDIITVDVGGTSSDIALISHGSPTLTSEGYLDGFRIRVPMVDVNAVGAGGGSIAWIDEGGGLRVGPQSAGAEPGPACYGRGGIEATVTDASIVLGYLDPAYFAGGTLELDPARSFEAIERQVARPLGLSVDAAALGIHRVVSAQMSEGIRLVSVRRGVDPRRFALVPFGGGGPLHAIALATDLGLTTIVVPRYPGVLSATGLLAAPIEHEASTAFLDHFDVADPRRIVQICAELDRRCTAAMAHEALAGVTPSTRFMADVCYVGQSYHLEVAIDLAGPDDLVAKAFETFFALHRELYGHATRKPARFVNLRCVQRAAVEQPRLPVPGSATGQALKGHRLIRPALAAGSVMAGIFDRALLGAGERIAGPAIIEQADTTTLIEPGWVAETHPAGALIVTPGA